MAYNETTDLPAVYNGSYGVTVTYNNTADLPVVYNDSYGVTVTYNNPVGRCSGFPSGDLQRSL